MHVFYAIYFRFHISEINIIFLDNLYVLCIEGGFLGCDVHPRYQHLIVRSLLLIKFVDCQMLWWELQHAFCMPLQNYETNKVLLDVSHLHRMPVVTVCYFLMMGSGRGLVVRVLGSGL